MKVYINQLNIELAPHFAETLRPFLHHVEHAVEVFTDEGIYVIDEEHTFRLQTFDKPIVQYPQFHAGVTLIADPSSVKRHIVSSVYGCEHHVQTVDTHVYKMPSHTHVTLVIQYVAKTRPKDIYFEVKADGQTRGVDDIFVKSELIEFLSHLF